MSTYSFAKNSDISGYLLSYTSNKLKHQLQYIASQNMDFTVATTNEKERNWWLKKSSLSFLDIDEKRLPLVLAKNVTFSQFAK
ncbi:unnamed protein product [Rhizophagus irregularis]|nr:unnamed protein product [Rhizophagus irregularis]